MCSRCSVICTLCEIHAHIICVCVFMGTGRTLCALAHTNAPSLVTHAAECSCCCYARSIRIVSLMDTDTGNVYLGARTIWKICTLTESKLYTYQIHMYAERTNRLLFVNTRCGSILSAHTHSELPRVRHTISAWFSVLASSAMYVSSEYRWEMRYTWVCSKRRTIEFEIGAIQKYEQLIWV